MLFDDDALEATFGEFLLTAQAGALSTSGLAYACGCVVSTGGRNAEGHPS
jgi:hypothetical protein